MHHCRDGSDHRPDLSDGRALRSPDQPTQDGWRGDFEPGTKQGKENTRENVMIHTMESMGHGKPLVLHNPQNRAISRRIAGENRLKRANTIAVASKTAAGGGA